MGRGVRHWRSHVNIWSVLVYTALFGALLLAWRLSEQSADLRTELAHTRMRVLQPHVGMPVPTFRGSTVSGDSITLGREAGPPQLLFFFSTSCAFCLESLEGWKRLARLTLRDSTSSVEVSWVSLSAADSTRDYVRRHRIMEPVLVMSDRRMAALYHANLVPMTVVINRGIVSYARLRAVSRAETIDSILTAVNGIDDSAGQSQAKR